MGTTTQGAPVQGHRVRVVLGGLDSYPTGDIDLARFLPQGCAAPSLDNGSKVAYSQKRFLRRGAWGAWWEFRTITSAAGFNRPAISRIATSPALTETIHFWRIWPRLTGSATTSSGGKRNSIPFCAATRASMRLQTPLPPPESRMYWICRAL